MTRNTIDVLQERKREEGIAAAGFEREFLSDCMTREDKTVRACRECGLPPRHYRRGLEHVLCCVRCGKSCTQETERGHDALKEWNDQNRKGEELRITNSGLVSESGKTFREEFGKFGVETIIK